MLQETLKNLGLKDKEIAIYLEIMKAGSTTPARIARLTNINRATVYSVIAVLQEKGIVSEDLGKKKRYINALPPEDLMALINREKSALNQKEKLVEKAIQEIKDLPLNTEYAVPHVRFFDHDALLKQLSENVSRWEESMQKTDPDVTWWGFQDHTFAERFADWIPWYWGRAPENVKLKLLTNKSEVEINFAEKNLERRVTKTMPKDTNFTATTWVLGEYLIMVYTNKEPFYAIEIFNPVLAHNHRELFKNIWNKY